MTIRGDNSDDEDDQLNDLVAEVYLRRRRADSVYNWRKLRPQSAKNASRTKSRQSTTDEKDCSVEGYEDTPEIMTKQNRLVDNERELGGLRAWGDGGGRRSLGIGPPADPKGQPFLLTTPKQRDFLVKNFQKVSKNAFFGFFQNFACGAKHLAKTGFFTALESSENQFGRP